MNLWDFMLGIDSVANQKSTVEAIFKSKDPETRYVNVKFSIINNGTQLIAVFTDITKMKEMEKEGQKLRSLFFSSVAHELRTPLNSVIPILKLVLEILSTLIQQTTSAASSPTRDQQRLTQ